MTYPIENDPMHPQNFPHLAKPEAVAGEFYEQLAKAKAKFLPIRRDKTVQVRTKTGGSYAFSYAPLESILAAITPALSEFGFSVQQTIKDGCVITRLCHKSASTDLAPVHIFAGAGCTAQEYGSALTYARRYSLTVALNISADDDDDGNAASGNEATPVSKNPTTRAQGIKLANAIKTEWEKNNEWGAFEIYEPLDNEMRLEVWGHLEPNIRRRIKEMGQEARKEAA